MKYAVTFTVTLMQHVNLVLTTSHVALVTLTVHRPWVEVEGNQCVHQT